jgi:hypothetical protein
MTEHGCIPCGPSPARGVFDGELVALDKNGRPDFPELCDCVLLRRSSRALRFIVFDVLSVEGRDVTRLQYSERRGSGLNDPRWRLLSHPTPRAVRRVGQGVEDFFAPPD